MINFYFTYFCSNCKKFNRAVFEVGDSIPSTVTAICVWCTTGNTFPSSISTPVKV